jgi:hypothetical protein
MSDDKNELYVGSVKLVDLNSEVEISDEIMEILLGIGFNMELVLSKVNKAFERADVQLALKNFQSKNGQETSIMLYASPLPEKDRNKWRTHSLKINTKYRQKEELK